MSRDPARHKLDMWPATVWCASTKGQLRKAAKAVGIALELGDHAGCTFTLSTEAEGLQMVVYVDTKGVSLGALVDTCAHEASHVADRLFEEIEERIPGTETRAYLVGWLTRWLLVHCDPKTFGAK